MQYLLETVPLKINWDYRSPFSIPVVKIDKQISTFIFDPVF
jgi:hypothetical protein